MGATRATSPWSLPSGSSRDSSHPRQETIALSCRGINEAARVHLGWAGIFKETWREMLLFHSHGLCSCPWDAQQVLPPSAQGPDGEGTHSPCPQRLPKLPPCYLPVCSSGATCWDVSGSLDFVHSAAKIRPAMLPRGTLFWFDTWRMHF